MLTRSLAAITVLSSVVVVGAGCGRSSPVQPVDEAEAELAAKGVCFDTKEELKAQLDTEYLAADTPTVSSADVDAAVSAAVDDATSVDALRGKLDTVYQGLGGNGLSQQDVLDLCFDSPQEVLDEAGPLLDTHNDARYLPIDFHDDFANLLNIPSGLLDGDNDTPPTGTAPIKVTGRDVSLDPTGCSTGETYVFETNAFVCEPGPAAPLNTVGVGSATANSATVEALPILTKIEVNALAVGAGASADTATLGAAARPKHRMLIVDAWAVQGGSGVANLTFEVRQGATQISAPAAVPANANDVNHITTFAAVANRQVNTNNDLVIRVANSGAAAASATFTVYILAIPF